MRILNFISQTLQTVMWLDHISSKLTNPICLEYCLYIQHCIGVCVNRCHSWYRCSYVCVYVKLSWLADCLVHWFASEILASSNSCMWFSTLFICSMLDIQVLIYYYDHDLLIILIMHMYVLCVYPPCRLWWVVGWWLFCMFTLYAIVRVLVRWNSFFAMSVLFLHVI